MKKGQGKIIFVLVLFIIMVFLFALVNIIGFKIQDDIDDYILEDVTLNESKEVINDVTDRYPSTFDGLAIFFMVGIWIVGIAAGLINDEHPILFGFMIFVCAAVLIAGMFLSNTFEEFIGDSDYTGMSVTFPATTWILTHLLEIGIMMLLSTIMAAIAKNKVS